MEALGPPSPGKPGSAASIGSRCSSLQVLPVHVGSHTHRPPVQSPPPWQSVELLQLPPPSGEGGGGDGGDGGAGGGRPSQSALVVLLSGCRSAGVAVTILRKQHRDPTKHCGLLQVTGLANVYPPHSASAQHLAPQAMAESASP